MHRWIAGFLLALTQGMNGGQTLRVAAVAPEGSEWAAQLKVFGREVDRATEGRVRIKVSLGGVAGDEPTALERVRRGHLDGLAGAIVCQRVAPSLRLLEILGLATNDTEADALLAALTPHVAEEVSTTPFAMLAVTGGFGHRVLLSRDPVRSLSDLRSRRWWVWDVDDVLRAQLGAMGVQVVPLPLDQALRAYQERRVDGFIVVPAAALAFGYSAHARWFTDLKGAYLPGCLLVSRQALASLSPADRRAVEIAAARLGRNFLERGRRVDDELLSYGFAKQGLREAAPTPAFRAELSRAADQATGILGSRLVPPALLSFARETLDRLRR